MGVDFIDLALSIEETFEIEMSVETFGETLTVGQLHDYIVQRTSIARPGTCLTSAAFYHIRSGLAECEIKERFGPSTDLESVIPKQDRRSLWKRFSRQMNLDLPDLARPPVVVILAAVVTIALTAIIAYASSWHSLVGLISLMVLSLLAVGGTRPFATRFADDWSTFRGLSERVLTLNAKELRKEHGPMGLNDTWVVLKGLVVEALGVEADEVTREASFVKDLGCS